MLDKNNLRTPVCRTNVSKSCSRTYSLRSFIRFSLGSAFISAAFCSSLSSCRSRFGFRALQKRYSCISNSSSWLLTCKSFAMPMKLTSALISALISSMPLRSSNKSWSSSSAGSCDRSASSLDVNIALSDKLGYNAVNAGR